MTPEEVLLHMMEQYNQTVATWQKQVHEMDSAFVNGEFGKYIKQELDDLKNGGVDEPNIG